MNDAPAHLALPGTVEVWLGRVAAVLPTVAAGAAEGEGIRHVPDAVMAALHDEGIFRLLPPREFGGAAAEQVPGRAQA